jgi:hypothetical protein
MGFYVYIVPIGECEFPSVVVLCTVCTKQGEVPFSVGGLQRHCAISLGPVWAPISIQGLPS